MKLDRGFFSCFCMIVNLLELGSDLNSEWGLVNVRVMWKIRISCKNENDIIRKIWIMRKSELA